MHRAVWLSVRCSLARSPSRSAGASLMIPSLNSLNAARPPSARRAGPAGSGGAPRKPQAQFAVILGGGLSPMQPLT
eukprot:9329379-Pyramimonas_sp.AAC.1